MHALFLAGEVIVAMVFMQTLLMAFLLLLLPATLLMKQMHAAVPPGIVYFLAIGSGFMLAEMFFVYTGTFLLGEPVIALAVVVTALLLSSGLGGIWAQQLRAEAIRPALLSAGGSVVLVAAVLRLFSQELLALPEGARYAVLALALMIPGFAMGVPFPLGMRHLLPRPVHRSFAWAVNGCASVLASVAAAQMAISSGCGLILFAAVLSYGAAALAGVDQPCSTTRN
jgi:predicted membrane-bound spermidine synthase